MKKRLEHYVEKELVRNSHRAMFELLELHDNEASQLRDRIAELERNAESLKLEIHQLNQTIYATFKSRSFRLGYALLHPVSALRTWFQRK